MRCSTTRRFGGRRCWGKAPRSQRVLIIAGPAILRIRLALRKTLTRTCCWSWQHELCCHSSQHPGRRDGTGSPYLFLRHYRYPFGFPGLDGPLARSPAPVILLRPPDSVPGRRQGGTSDPAQPAGTGPSWCWWSRFCPGPGEPCGSAGGALQQSSRRRVKGQVLEATENQPGKTNRNVPAP